MTLDIDTVEELLKAIAIVHGTEAAARWRRVVEIVRHKERERNRGSVELVEVCVPDLPKIGSIGERGPGPWWTARSGLDPCDERHPPQECKSDRCYVKRERNGEGR